MVTLCRGPTRKQLDFFTLITISIPSSFFSQANFCNTDIEGAINNISSAYMLFPGNRRYRRCSWLTNCDMSYWAMLLQLIDNHIKQWRSYGEDTASIFPEFARACRLTPAFNMLRYRRAADIQYNNVLLQKKYKESASAYSQSQCIYVPNCNMSLTLQL